MAHGRGACLWMALALLAAACAAPPPRTLAPASESSPPQRAGPKRITVAIYGEISSMRSQTTTITPGLLEVEQVINAGLAAVDEQGNLHPRVAENVPAIENGLWQVFPDGSMETRWVIRERARWHDGAPFTASDVEFTVMQVGKDPELPAYRHLTYDSIEGMETPDARTVVVRWHRVNIDADKLLSTMGTPWPVPLPKHLLEKSHMEDKANFMQVPYWGQEFVGLGPYKLRDWVIGSHVLLEANADYVLGRPKIDEIEVKFVPDVNALVANIASGAVDANLGRGLSLEQGLQLREMWQAGRMDIAPRSWVVIFPQLINPNPAVMLDVRFRRAVLHAIDRQALVDNLMQGQSTIAHIFLNPDEPEYRDIEASIVRYDYDPAAAMQLIEQLGYGRGADGTFVAAGGQPLSVNMQTTAADIQQKTLFSVADGLKRVGVGPDPEVLAPQRVPDRAYRSQRPGFELTRNPNSLSAFLSRNHGSQTPLPEDNFRRYTNKSRYMNPGFDALIDRYFAAIPRPERVQVLGRIVRHMTENLLYLGLFYDVEPMAVANRLANVEPRKGELASSIWNVHEWDVKL